MDLGEIVRTAVDELRAANPRAEIVVDSEAPVRGMWDPDRLAQVASNLVGNAIVHGGGRVEVRVKRTGGDAVLEVRNDGPPIPADTLPRIFEAFQRSTGADGLRYANGLGLGLFIADRIVAAHRGRIAVRSNDQEGTTFLVTIPAYAAEGTSSRASDPEVASPRVAIG